MYLFDKFLSDKWEYLPDFLNPLYNIDVYYIVT